MLAGNAAEMLPAISLSSERQRLRAARARKLGLMGGGHNSTPEKRESSYLFPKPLLHPSTLTARICTTYHFLQTTTQHPKVSLEKKPQPNKLRINFCPLFSQVLLRKHPCSPRCVKRAQNSSVICSISELNWKRVVLR